MDSPIREKPEDKQKMINILEELASATGQRDEGPNQALAAKIAAARDAKAVAELVENLKNKSRDIQSDCIKVLYEIAAEAPELLSPYFENILALLDSKNNRMQWGAMTTLNAIAQLNKEALYEALPKLMEAANAGSVITKDHAVAILVKLSASKEYSEKVFPLLMKQFAGSPENQFPMYAENILPVINEGNKKRYISIIQERIGSIEKPAKRKRLEQILKKINR